MELINQKKCIKSAWMDKSKKYKSCYLENMKQLYGSTHEKIDSCSHLSGFKEVKSRKISVRKNPTERQEQIWFVTWLKKQGYWCHHSPNGGKRHFIEGYNLKLMGVSKGFPDVFVPLPMGKYHSLFIEMKPLKGGKIEKEQSEWINYLREKGFYAEVAHGFEEAKRIFLEYLSSN